MEFRRGQTQSLNLLSFTIFLLSLLPIISADDCQPATWAAGALRRAAATPTITFNKSSSVANIGNVQPGQINCRYWGSTYGDVNYYTCTQLANKYGITVDFFFELNPELNPDCGNVQQYTDYCVDGFIEPLRATNGLCGPPNNNATCLGTPLQCCNAATWTCGNSTADCAPGSCYEGACAGDRVYSTDGTCGYQYSNRLCAGNWGDCCNKNGTCGTGSGFCGIDVCQSGNCTKADTPPSDPPWSIGNTTDGTCGGANYYTCNVVYGNCCNKDGLCGSLSSDCGVGCQPQFGNCSSMATSISSSTSTSTSKSITSTASVGTSKSTSSTTLTSTTKSTSSTAINSASKSTSSTAITSTTKLTSSTAITSASKSTSSTAITSASKSTSSTVNTSTSKSTSSSKTSSTTIAASSGTTIKTTISTSSSKTTSTTKAASSVTTISTSKSTSSSKTTVATSTVTGVAALPSCGQLCFNNMLAQYSSLGCATPDPACLCENVNFGYGIRDCSNGACGTTVASTVIAFGSSYCSSATASRTIKPSSATASSKVTGIAALPSCGQLCFNNMLAQYSSLGCATPDPTCLCKNVNFGYGIRDCSNGACGTAVASTVIAFGSSYCASATATPTGK